MLAFEHFEGELVAGRPALGVEETAVDDPTSILARRDRLQVVGGLCILPDTGDAIPLRIQ